MEKLNEPSPPEEREGLPDIPVTADAPEDEGDKGEA